MPQTTQDKRGLWLQNYDGTYGTLYPNGDKPENLSSTLTITGTGYGSGPNVVLFDQFIGTHGQSTFAGRTPEVGNWTAVSSYGNGDPQMYYDEATNRTWLSCRDINNIGQSGIRNRSLYKYTGDITEFSFSLRAYVPIGFRFPDAPTAGAQPDDSSWKMTWFSQGPSNGNTLSNRDSPARNVCIPTQIGSGSISIGGNNNGPSYFQDYVRAIYGNFSHTAPTFYNWYQSGAGTYNVYDQIGEFICANNNTVTRQIRSIDPFHSSSAGQESTFTTRSYNAFEFTGWFTDSYNYINCLPLLTDARLAVGPNSRACVLISNSPTLLTAGQIYHGDIISWDNTNGIQFKIYAHSDFGPNTHVHVIKADGTLIENVTFTRG